MNFRSFFVWCSEVCLDWFRAAFSLLTFLYGLDVSLRALKCTAQPAACDGGCRRSACGLFQGGHRAASQRERRRSNASLRGRGAVALQPLRALLRLLGRLLGGLVLRLRDLGPGQ